MTALGIPSNLQAVITAASLIAAQSNLYVSRGYLSGYTISPATTVMNVSAGDCADDTAVQIIRQAAGSINCAANGVNGLDTGALANNTLYHFFAICNPTSQSFGFLASTSLSPTMPAGYTLKRRIASWFTDGSAHFRAGTQIGDEFIPSASVLDVNAVACSATPASKALSVPSGTGLNVRARIIAANAAGAAGQSLWVYSPLMSDEAGGATESLSRTASTNTQPCQVDVWTDALGQVRVVSDGASGTYSIRTIGWTDTRGRFA